MWLWTTATGVRSVSVQCGDGMDAAMLPPRWNELLPAGLHASRRRMHCPGQPNLPPLAAGLHLLGQLRTDVLPLVGQRPAALRRITVLTVRLA